MLEVVIVVELVDLADFLEGHVVLLDSYIERMTREDCGFLQLGEHVVSGPRLHGIS